MPQLDESILATLTKGYALPESKPWQKLLRRLELSNSFTFHTVIAPDGYGVEIARRTLAAWAEARGLSLHTIIISPDDSPETLTRNLLAITVPKSTILWVQAGDPHPGLDPDAFVENLWHPAIAILNSRRNPLQRQLEQPLILAGPEHLQIVIREHAPDLWSIRASVTYLEPPAKFRAESHSQSHSQMSGDERVSGDPNFTLAEAQKLANDPAQRLLRAKLLHRAGVQFLQKQQWQAAEQCLLQAWEIRQADHAPPEDRFHTLLQLGLLFDEAGNYPRAVYYARQANEQAMLAFGTNHPHTLGSRSNLANLLAALGEFSEAEAEHRDILERREHMLGAEHPDTLASRANLANTLREQGKYVEAETEQRGVLKLMEKVLGPEHPETLGSRNNLANTLDDQGKYAEAETEYRAVVKLKEKALGAEHPSMLGSRSNLAEALRAQGKYAEAEAEQRAVIKLKEKVLGAEHPETLGSRNNQANVLYAQGKNTEAAAEFRAVLKLQEKVLGAEHPSTLMSCYNLAVCLHAQKKFAEAKVFAERAAAGAVKVLGAEHPYAKSYQELWQELQ